MNLDEVIDKKKLESTYFMGQPQKYQLNDISIKTIEDANKGIDIVHCTSQDDLFKKLNED